MCEGAVGAILCIEASRLARNGRDWHHLIDLCSLVGTLIIDPDGIYNPLVINDRLLLGLKGTMSEFELTLLKQRSMEALRQKARRGELKFCLPIGLCWTRTHKIELEPDRRVQEAIKLVFKKFVELGSARQVLLWFREENISLPRNEQDEFGSKIVWQLPIYRSILTILQNPLYAGAYAFGKTEQRTRVVHGRAHKTDGHKKSRDQWMVLIKDHHPSYISWDRFEKNQVILLENTHMRKEQSPKSGRGGRVLLAGLIRCGRCSRMIHVVYAGLGGKVARYYCRGAHINHGTGRCISFGSLRADQAMSAEILRAVEGDAIDAAFKASEQIITQQQERRKALSLELEQARYEANIASRRYESVDPANRLVADELESRWNQALRHVKEVEMSLAQFDTVKPRNPMPNREDFIHLGENLSMVWDDPSTDMRLKQRVIRLLICEVVAHVNEKTNETVLVIHWKGGQHSELKVARNQTGRHGRSTEMDAIEVIKQMAATSSDKAIAATLNRLGLQTGAGNPWNRSRVRGARNDQNLPAFDPNKKDGSTVTLDEAAKELKVSRPIIRRLIKLKIIDAHQPVSCAPWQIRREELGKESVSKIIQAIKSGKKFPRSLERDEKTLMLFSL